jgi:phosphotriesterase-related protein
MHRRKFIQQTAVLGLLHPFAKWAPGSKEGQFITVTGPIAASSLGFILPHEHVLVDFIGADKVNPDRYNRQEVAAIMLPLLIEAKKAGCTAFFDCTPQYLGRDVLLLQQLSRSAGLPIITNTGLYSARNNLYIPAAARTQTAAQMAAEWIREFEQGIEGTAIRPGFIKISVDKEPLTEVNKKVVLAAALTHKATGLTIASHTGSGAAALEQLDILKVAGVDASAFVWVHAQNEKESKYYLTFAKTGGWVSFDGLGWQPVEDYVAYIKLMQQHKLMQQVLISHDAGWYNVGEEKGGKQQPFTALFLQLIPQLKAAGFTDKTLMQLFHHNPAAAFSVRKRLL